MGSPPVRRPPSGSSAGPASHTMTSLNSGCCLARRKLSSIASRSIKKRSASLAWCWRPTMAARFPMTGSSIRYGC